GTLHNKSVRPKIEISNIKYDETELSVQLYRIEGADVYGSFLIGIQIIDEKGEIVRSINQFDLANFPAEKINNHYVAKIKPGANSLVIPLGAKADISLDLNGLQ